MKCTKTECGADIADGQKFCGGCGTSAPEPMTKAICPQEHENPAGTKFCGECGEGLAPALAAEFAKDLGAVEALAKAQLPTAIAFVDPADLGNADDDDPEKIVAALLKGSVGHEVEGVEGVNVMDPEYLLKSIGALVDAAARGPARALAKAIDAMGAEILQLRQENRVLAKAQATNMRSLSALETGTLGAIVDQLEKLGAVRLPRKAAVTVLTKSLSAEKPADLADGEKDESLRGEPLVKALCVAAERGAESGLSEIDVGMAQHWANRNYSLSQISKIDAGLGARLTAALGATTH